VEPPAAGAAAPKTMGATVQTATPPSTTATGAPSRGTSERSPRSWAKALRCVACGERAALTPVAACQVCLGPLAIEYELSDRAGALALASRIRTDGTIARYAELLPPIDDPTHAYALETTPLRTAARLASELDLAAVYLKDDTVLPTGSFKDRAATVAVAQAVRFGYRAVGCASTGNLAAATARAAARAGLPAFIFVPRGLPEAKLDPVRRLGGTLVEVDGPYDAANRVAFLAGEEARIGLLNITLRPYYTEGSKLAGHEILDAITGPAPSHLIVPLGSGALLAATARAIAERRALGWLPGTDPGPALIGTQPEGCAPIVDAFQRGTEEIIPVEKPDTIAESLAIGDPASGPEALRAIRASGGTADSPTTAEVLRGIADVARLEGIWVEPAGGTVIATLRRLRESAVLGPNDRVVAHLTGAGWKAPHVARGAGKLATIAIDPRRPDLRELHARLPTGSSTREAAPW
jgi:threonine synthase